MPFYDYTCDDCGSFTLSRSVTERDQVALCPECDGKAVRVVSAPNLNLMPSGRREAFARNEKSQHEPGVKTRHRCKTG